MPWHNKATKEDKMLLSSLFLAIFACLSTVFAENQLTERNRRTKKVVARNPDRWNFAKSCIGPRCQCWSDGCWQQIQTCFGLDCYLWQCFGPNCGCPSETCISSCVGANCVLEVITVEEVDIPGHWVWTEESHHRRRHHH